VLVLSSSGDWLSGSVEGNCADLEGDAAETCSGTGAEESGSEERVTDL